jgi:hypothetical protein
MKGRRGVWWYTPIILAMQEVEMGIPQLKAKVQDPEK